MGEGSRIEKKRGKLTPRDRRAESSEKRKSAPVGRNLSASFL